MHANDDDEELLGGREAIAIALDNAETFAEFPFATSFTE